MALSHPPLASPTVAAVPAQGHAVSWPAVLAGAAGAAALSLILLILGTGLGLASVSPWVHEGIAATTFGVGTIVWISFTQLVASGMGGYLAGRLRTRWSDTPADEVYFRDTAHGFLAWAIASLATAALLTTAVGSIVGAGVQAGATVASGGATAAGAALTQTATPASEPERPPATAYFVDALFRSGANPPLNAEPPTPGALAAEATAILLNALRAGALPAEDAEHLARQVALRTGLDEAAARQRVTEGFNRLQTQTRETEAAAREAADKARKASAYGALWLFVSLLIGAFFASLAATFGGRQRDAS